MGTYMIPRNTKGEGRILYIFSTKALIFTVVGARNWISILLVMQFTRCSICWIWNYRSPRINWFYMWHI